MNTHKLQIPSGMQDTLPGECRRQRDCEQSLRNLFRLHGYQEIATPVLEYYDALDDATYGYRPEDVWKTFDANGRVLAIRPDTTIPAVRIAAGRLKDSALPLRLCYMQSAAGYHSDTASLLCEQPQAGVELMGVSGACADAEVIALAYDSLAAAGLEDFQLEIGQAGFFNGFMMEAGLTEGQSRALRGMVEQKNALAMQLYLDQLSVSREVTRRLMQLPQLYGDASVLDEAEKLTKHPVCREAIANLREIYRILQAYGCADRISFDLGMVHHANYYSGVIFRGITATLGQPLMSGGRYDGLPEKFGRKMPAVGFAVSLKLVMMALERQGETFGAPVPDELLGYDPDSFAEALAYARERRAQGVSVAMEHDAAEMQLADKVRQGLARSASYIRHGQRSPVEGEVK